MTTSLIR